MFAQFAWQDQSDGGLNVTATQCGFLVVPGNVPGFHTYSLKDVVDEAVHHGHAFPADACVRVHLLQNLEDVGAVGLASCFLDDLAVFAQSWGLAGFAGFAFAFSMRTCCSLCDWGLRGTVKFYGGDLRLIGHGLRWIGEPGLVCLKVVLTCLGLYGQCI